MQNRSNNGFNNSNTDIPNKGFTIHVGDTYIGFLTVAEFNKQGKRVMPEHTAENMQKPENMAALLSKAELRPYKPVEEADTASVDEIMESVGKEAQASQEDSESGTEIGSVQEVASA